MQGNFRTNSGLKASPGLIIDTIRSSLLAVVPCSLTPVKANAQTHKSAS